MDKINDLKFDKYYSTEKQDTYGIIYKSKSFKNILNNLKKTDLSEYQKVIRIINNKKGINIKEKGIEFEYTTMMNKNFRHYDLSKKKAIIKRGQEITTNFINNVIEEENLDNSTTLHIKNPNNTTGISQVRNTKMKF